jgi:hypothetical protein
MSETRFSSMSLNGATILPAALHHVVAPDVEPLTVLEERS